MRWLDSGDECEQTPETAKDGNARVLQSMESQRVGPGLATEQ